MATLTCGLRCTRSKRGLLGVVAFAPSDDGKTGERPESVLRIMITKILFLLILTNIQVSERVTVDFASN